MNDSNILKLGAFCQREFGMGKDFKVLIVDYNKLEVALPVFRMNYLGFETLVGTDVVKLEKVVDPETMECARVGYSKKANVLVVRFSGEKE